MINLRGNKQMNLLTKDEIDKYIKTANRETGVDEISREKLERLDLDTVPDVVSRIGCVIKTSSGESYNYDSFTPKANSTYLKPSFAGRQIAIAKQGREVIFSNGRWFQL